MPERIPEGYVEAVWVGPYDGTLEDGTPLISGETSVVVPAGEAEASDYWQPRSGRKNVSDDAVTLPPPPEAPTEEASA